MKRIYIACPISRGDLLHNIQQADAVFFALLAAGFYPLCPHWSVYAGGTSRQFSNVPGCRGIHAVANTLPRNTTHEQWVALGLAWVEVADAVLRLPGDSVGADAEVAHAQSKGIPVYYSVEEVLDALSGNIRHSYANGRPHPWYKARSWRGKPRITSEQKQQIKALRSQGLLFREIGAQFNLGTTHVQRIIREVSDE